MLYTKYKSSGPCSFRLEDFLKLHFENLFFDPVAYLCKKIGMVWTTLVEEIVDAQTDGRTDALTDRHWAITKAHLEHFVLRWAKNNNPYLTLFALKYTNRHFYHIELYIIHVCRSETSQLSTQTITSSNNNAVVTCEITRKMYSAVCENMGISNIVTYM